MGDYRTTLGEARPLSRKTVRKRRLLIALAVLLVLAGLAAAGFLIRIERYAVAGGYVTTEEYAEVRPAAVGIVARICASSGDYVEQGALLVELDSREEQASLEEAGRRVRQMEVDLERRKAEMEVDLERRKVALDEQKRTHNDAIAIARLQLKNAETKLTRSEELVDKGLKAGSALEDDRLREELARAELASLLARDLAIYEQLLSRDRATYDRELAVMEQELQARRDTVVRAQARVRAKEIRAPIAGQVLRYEFVIGELVRPETVLYEIFGGDEQVLRLQVGERYATKVAVGQRYSAVLTGVSHRGLRTVYFTGSVESLRNVIQAEGKRTYRVAYCDFDQKEYRIPPGTTAEARIYYGHSSLLYYLFNIDP